MSGEQAGAAEWYALWTSSNCEQRVHDQLSAKGFRLYLPKVEGWTRRGGARRRSHVPLFPGYLFLRHRMDKTSYLAVCQTTGVARVLGERWDRLAVIPDTEIERLQRVATAGLRVRPHAFLREGQRVRITTGVLTDVEGILVREKWNKGLVVISVAALERSIAVEVDCTVVEAA